MSSKTIARASACAFTLSVVSLFPSTAYAGEENAPDILVTAAGRIQTIENSAASTASIDALRIDDTVNAMNVEDTLKYLPSLLIRKRNIGDTQAPLATRTSGVGASARSLIYADGVLLSALIGNNNSTASPRWGLVSSDEIERIDVLYGPFSAAYPGNSIGAVVNITTRLPDTLEGTFSVGTSVQRFSQYATRDTLPAYQLSATLGDRLGPLAIFMSANHVVSDSQPLSYATAVRPVAPAAGGAVVTGSFDGLNRAGVPIVILGAGGIERQRHDNLKFKAVLDVAPGTSISYIAGLFLNDVEGTAESYLRDASGQSVYAGTLNIGGHRYTIPANTFSNGASRFNERHWSHSLSATGASTRFDWQLIGAVYDYGKDVQRSPTTALPAAFAGGSGNITRLDGTGWHSFDAKGLWRTDAAATHAIGFGYHRDRFELNSNRYATTDWMDGSEGVLNLASRGRTRTDGLWLQDAWRIAAPLTLTIGGRYEWWKAYDGFNFSLTPALSANQPRLSARRFSPKASLAWTPSEAWKVSLSMGQAFRFPTVSELYQAVTTGLTITVPNPALRPERARSAELAIERRDNHGMARLSFFSESVSDALISQSAPLLPGSSTLFNYVQNVDRVRARGMEFAFQQRDILAKGFDLAGSVTLVDPKIIKDVAFPAATGKNTPQVPKRKATLVATYRPDARVSLTAAARYSSRSFATIDNSDPVSQTYQGFADYFVIDFRANFKVTPHWSMAVGVDNANNDKYFLFHPFPQRTVSAELTYKL